MENQKPIQTTIIKIDPWSIIKILIVLIALVFVYLIRDIILLFLGALILTFIFSPFVDFLEKKRVPRVLGTLLIYLVILFILVGIIIPMVPVFSQEIKFLTEKMPVYLSDFSKYLGGSDEGWSGILRKILTDWSSQVNITSYGVFSVLGTFFGWVFIIGTLFLLAFYLTVQKEILKQTAKTLVPEKYQENLIRLVDIAQRDIGAWARGLLILGLVVGLMDYIGLSILGVNFALVLAFLAGIFEAVPWLGPWLAGIPAVLIALTQSPVKALMVIILYFVVQQIENNLIVPYVMKRTVGLNPLLVIIVLLIGAKLAGPVGIILAVPVVTILIIFVREYLRIKKA